MIYANGESVQIGDTVHLGGNQSGVIVGIIADGEYADGYKKKDWEYLGNGLIVVQTLETYGWKNLMRILS